MKATPGERIKKYMEINNLRQADIMIKCRPYMRKMNINFSRSTLSHYIAGRCNPNQEKLTVLALALDVSEAWLAGYDVPMSRASDKVLCSAKGKDIILVEDNHDMELYVEKFKRLSPQGRERVIELINELCE